MKVYIELQSNKALEVAIDSFTFSGGEEHIQINVSEISEDVSSIRVIAQLNSSENVMRLFMLKDAIDRMLGNSVKKIVEIRYFPYARQDRVCNKGEAFGVKVMANMVNAMNFDEVIIWDAHSDVTPALIDNVINVPQYEIIKQYQPLANALKDNEIMLVSPDSGALKKTLDVASYFEMTTDIIRADKKRDIQTREITETLVYGDVNNKQVLIIDDICDGGRTFIELAKVLKQKGAASVCLYVTHGIFCRGLDAFDGLIDVIYTTNSFHNHDELKQSSKCKLIVINEDQ